MSHTGSFGWDVSSGGIYWSQETFRIFEYQNPGDFVVIYSDGVPDAVNNESEFFEEARLRALISEFEGKTAQELATAIWAGVKTFTAGAPQSDDSTVLVIQCKGSVA